MPEPRAGSCPQQPTQKSCHGVISRSVRDRGAAGLGKKTKQKEREREEKEELTADQLVRHGPVTTKQRQRSDEERSFTTYNFRIVGSDNAR